MWDKCLSHALFIKNETKTLHLATVHSKSKAISICGVFKNVHFGDPATYLCYLGCKIWRSSLYCLWGRLRTILWRWCLIAMLTHVAVCNCCCARLCASTCIPQQRGKCHSYTCFVLSVADDSSNLMHCHRQTVQHGNVHSKLLCVKTMHSPPLCLIFVHHATADNQ